MKYPDITLGRVEAVWNKLGGEEGVGRFLRGDLMVSELRKPRVGTQEFSVTVDYSQTLEEMIAAGHYDWKNSDINQDNFPVRGEGKKEVEVTLVHFNRLVESDEAIREMEAKGYRPATIEELLALGKEQPDLQRSFPIIALVYFGYVNDERRVPCLRKFGSKRHLYLGWFVDRWDDEDCRFAFVCK